MNRNKPSNKGKKNHFINAWLLPELLPEVRLSNLVSLVTPGIRKSNYDNDDDDMIVMIGMLGRQ
jgi:hypothetical protein